MCRRILGLSGFEGHGPETSAYVQNGLPKHQNLMTGKVKMFRKVFVSQISLSVRLMLVLFHGFAGGSSGLRLRHHVSVYEIVKQNILQV